MLPWRFTMRPPSLRGVCMGASVVLPWCFRGISVGLPWCIHGASTGLGVRNAPMETSVMLPRIFPCTRGTSHGGSYSACVAIPWCFHGVSMGTFMLPWSFRGTPMVRPLCFDGASVACLPSIDLCTTINAYCIGKHSYKK